MFIDLRRCHVGVENLHKLVMIYEHWPSYAQLDCKLVHGNKLVEFFVVENMLLEQMMTYLRR